MNKTSVLWFPFRDYLVLDLRALGLFRIFLGICLIIDFLDRLKDVEIFYTSSGIAYPSVFTGNIFSNNTFSINFLSDNVTFQTAVLVLGLIVSVLFTLGYFTKISTILLWIFVASLQNLNTLILQGGDDYIRMLLFWSMFLPLGRRLSIDALHLSFLKENRYFSVANLGLIFQIAFMYFFTAMLKDSPIWTTDYTAVYYALSLDTFRTPIGDILLNIRWLPSLLTFMAIWIERLVPFLILLPFYNQFTRILAVFLIINLHIGIGLGMDVGPFTWISIVAAISLIHTQWLDMGVTILKRFLGEIRIEKARRLRDHIVSLFKKVPYLAVKVTPRSEKNKWLNRFHIAISASVIFSLLTIILIINVNTLGYKYTIGELPSKVTRFLRIDQSWKMFAPYPSFEGGWTVVTGYDTEGESYSLYQGNTTAVKPDAIYANPKNERWRKYTMNLWNGDRYTTERIYLLGYYCRQSHAGKIEGVPGLNKLEFYHVVETTQPDYREKTRVLRLLTTMECSS